MSFDSFGNLIASCLETALFNLRKSIFEQQQQQEEEIREKEEELTEETEEEEEEEKEGEVEIKKEKEENENANSKFITPNKEPWKRERAFIRLMRQRQKKLKNKQKVNPTFSSYSKLTFKLGQVSINSNGKRRFSDNINENHSSYFFTPKRHNSANVKNTCRRKLVY
jgi:hypothetical protein